MCYAALLVQSSRRNFTGFFRTIHLTSTIDAARKGTREKARQKKVKVEVKKVGFVPHILRNQNKANMKQVNMHVDDSWKALPKDNVYIGKFYRWKEYSFHDAVECHRETHHPTMYNVTNAPIKVEIELNMQSEKSTRFLDDFKRTVAIPHKFNHGEDRKILVFAKSQEHILEANDAGATLAGGIELIKEIQNGGVQLTDYQYVIAHPSILPDLVCLRGVMKKKFPSPKNGSLATNLPEAIGKFLNGINYFVTKHEIQKDFGFISTYIGPLDMESAKLEENLAALLKDIDSVRPKRLGKFITRVLLKSSPSGEQLKINPFVYVNEEYVKTVEQFSEEAEKVAIEQA